MNLFLNQKDLADIRNKIEQHFWARRLYELLETNPRHGNMDTGNPAPINTHIWEQGRRARDKALVYAISGDDTHVPEIVGTLKDTFHTNALSEPLDTLDETLNDWSYGLFRGGHFWAFDLIKDHVMLRGGFRNALEKRIAEILNTKKRTVSEMTALSNTSLWNVTTVGMLGFLLGDSDGVDVAINGKYGFKMALEQLRDRMFWPEATVYGYHYVSCCLTILAEADMKNGSTDLYHYVSPSGCSIRSMFDGWVKLLYSDGRIATHGDNSQMAEEVSAKEKNTGHDFSDTFLFNNPCYRDCNKFEIAYRAYHDPVYAWIISQNPNRDVWDHTFWGYSALTHGIPLEQKVPPSARSSVFGEYGCALIRSEEGPAYWHSRFPSVYVRNGCPQGHGHKDHFGLVMHAFGKTIYPDWFIQWDYSLGQFTRGRILNNTHFSRRIFAHNTVMVDATEPDRSEITFSPVERYGEMKVLTTAGIAYAGIFHKRILGLTKEYLIEIFELASDLEHTYDYLLHGFGRLDFNGICAWESYDGFAREYGLEDKIDPEAKGDDNTWIRPGYTGRADDDLGAIFKDTDGIGSNILFMGEKNTQVFTTDTPYYVSSYGWDDPSADGSIRKLPFLIIRRRASHTTFIAVHQPFYGTSSVLSASRTGKDLTISGDVFVDRMNTTLSSFERKPVPAAPGGSECVLLT